MNRLRYYSILLVVIALIFIGCASTAPLPISINIFEAPPDIPPEVAGFTGVWYGKWQGALDTILVISKIHNDKADIIFSLGDQGGAILIPQNSYSNVVASINKGTMEWTQPNGHTFVFKLEQGFKKMKGYFINSRTGGKTWAYLKKVEIKNVSQSKVNYYRYPPTRAVFTTGLNQNDYNAPIDNVDKISLKTNRIYLHVTWFDLISERHDIKYEIYDGTGYLIHTASDSMLPTESSWYSWLSYNFSPLDPVGNWTFKVYFNNKLAVYRELEVLAE